MQFGGWVPITRLSIAPGGPRPELEHVSVYDNYTYGINAYPDDQADSDIEDVAGRFSACPQGPREEDITSVPSRNLLTCSWGAGPDKDLTTSLVYIPKVTVHT